MRPVALLGVGMTPFGKFMDRSLKELAAEAIGAAVADAGVDLAAIDAAFSGNSMAGIMTGQECVRAQTVLAPLGIRGIPTFNVENACATSSSALSLAVTSVAAGQSELALVFGMEKLYHEDRTRAATALAAATDIEADTVDASAASPFMEFYARSVRAYAEFSGARPEDFAEVSVKNRSHAARNPYAQFRQPITVDDVLGSPMIAEPLTRLMCSPIGDGAAAVLVAPAERHPEAVRIVASIVRSGAGGGEHDTVRRAAAAAYEVAGLGPDDVDVAEVHDAASPAELMAYEDLGFCAPGDGPRLLADGVTRLGGRLPVNPSGGLVSRGHPVGATGVAQVVELTWQLRGQAGDRQVDGARVALAENAGGNVADDAAAVTVHLLRRP